MSLWNERNLPMPPISRYKANNKSFDLDHLIQVIKSGKRYYESSMALYTEAVLLSRLIYRMKLKGRHMKDWKILDKINRALEIYYGMNLMRAFQTFHSLLSEADGVHDTYLPTKNLLDYILVQLQGLSKLMVRLVDVCQYGASLLQVQMQIGHYWKLNILCFAIVSRVYVLARYMVKFTCNLYIKLLPFSKKLQNNGGRNFLPDNYMLPKDLHDWLGVDWIDEKIDTIEIIDETPRPSQFFDLVDSDDDVEFCDEYIAIKDDDEDEVQLTKVLTEIKKKLNPNVLRGFLDEDVGEIISLDEENSIIDVGDDSMIIEHDDDDIMIEDKKIKRRKRKQKKNINSGETEKHEVNSSCCNSVIDIGEDVTIENVETSRKIKTRKRKQKLKKADGRPIKKNKVTPASKMKMKKKKRSLRKSL